MRGFEFGVVRESCVGGDCLGRAVSGAWGEAAKGVFWLGSKETPKMDFGGGGGVTETAFPSKSPISADFARGLGFAPISPIRGPSRTPARPGPSAF